VDTDRANILLRAVLDIAKKCDDGSRDFLCETAFYDDADCDGYCLIQDIKDYLDIGDE